MGASRSLPTLISRPPPPPRGGGGGERPPSFLTASHKGPFILNQVRGDGFKGEMALKGSWWDLERGRGGGEREKNMALKGG